MTSLTVWILAGSTQLLIQGDLQWQAGPRRWTSSRQVTVRAEGDRLLVGGRSLSRVHVHARRGTGIQMAGRLYPGNLDIKAQANRLVIHNRLSLEDYVAGAVQAEVADHWPNEAVKAQAIVSRNFASRSRHGEVQVCDTSHCQIYRGRANDPAILKAVTSTRGTFLLHQGRLAETLFTSTCGGMRRDHVSVFGGRALPYLRGGPDPHCSGSPHWGPWRWRWPYPEPLRIQARDAQGLPLTLSWPGHGQLPLLTFWQTIGPGNGWTGVRSLNFDLADNGKQIVIQGTGLGHGVGLCQWGSRRMAEKGQTHAEILAFYFPGTRLTKETP